MSPCNNNSILIANCSRLYQLFFNFLYCWLLPRTPIQSTIIACYYNQGKMSRSNTTVMTIDFTSYIYHAKTYYYKPQKSYSMTLNRHIQKDRFHESTRFIILKFLRIIRKKTKQAKTFTTQILSF